MAARGTSPRIRLEILKDLSGREWYEQACLEGNVPEGMQPQRRFMFKWLNRIWAEYDPSKMTDDHEYTLQSELKPKENGEQLPDIYLREAGDGTGIIRLITSFQGVIDFERGPKTWRARDTDLLSWPENQHTALATAVGAVGAMALSKDVEERFEIRGPEDFTYSG